MNLHKRRVGAVVEHVNFIDPPIDFSFLGLVSPCDAVDEIPRIRNVNLKKGESRKFKSNTLHLNNNLLSDCAGLTKIVNSYFSIPNQLRWLNLANNQLQSVPDDLLELQQLQILYFHGNILTNVNQIGKLRNLHNLRSLTLHGNPIEKEDNYRTRVLMLLPALRSLDFSDVTTADTFVAQQALVMDQRIRRRRQKAREYD